MFERFVGELGTR